jgi:anti-sigma factor RsiW
MKDSKFIELLNLYVDHQISEADAALLEAEIQKQPERRQIYRQYCQMQKACVMLADNFRTEAPAVGKSVAFAPARRRFAPTAYAMAAVAAAACIALVMTNRTRPDSVAVASTHASEPVVQVAAQAVPAELVTEPVILPARVPLQPAFDGSLKNTAVNFAATDSARVPLAWIKNVQLQRVPIEELRFETQRNLQPQELIFRDNAQTFQGQMDRTAWQFTK